MQTVLITGAAGGIGTRLCPLLKGVYPSIRLSDVRRPADLAAEEPGDERGVALSGATLGPLRSRNAGVSVSSARCETVCRNGKVGVVNGVVMPAISIQTRPYPELRMVLSVAR